MPIAQSGKLRHEEGKQLAPVMLGWGHMVMSVLEHPSSLWEMGLQEEQTETSGRWSGHTGHWAGREVPGPSGFPAKAGDREP